MEDCLFFDENDGLTLGKEPGAMMANTLGEKSALVLQNSWTFNSGKFNSRSCHPKKTQRNKQQKFSYLQCRLEKWTCHQVPERNVQKNIYGMSIKLVEAGHL